MWDITHNKNNPIFTHTHGDELTASKWVRGHPFVANILRKAQSGDNEVGMGGGEGFTSHSG